IRGRGEYQRPVQFSDSRTAPEASTDREAGFGGFRGFLTRKNVLYVGLLSKPGQCFLPDLREPGTLLFAQSPSSPWLNEGRDLIEQGERKCEGLLVVPVLHQLDTWDGGQLVGGLRAVIHFDGQQVASVRVDYSPFARHLHHPRVTLVFGDVVGVIGG